MLFGLLENLLSNRRFDFGWSVLFNEKTNLGMGWDWHITFRRSSVCCVLCVQETVRIKLGLITDPEMLSTILGAIRGGLSFTSTRILRACPLHNPNVHLIYCDANNLYGLCQTKKLPCGNYKFVDNAEKVAKDIIANYKPTDSTGYIFKVDLVSWTFSLTSSKKIQFFI